MIVAVHALVGAAIGKLTGRKAGAYASGVSSHLICDLLPHKDFDPKIEAALLAGTLGVLAARFGVNSPEFIGAMGAVSPDFENAAARVGLASEAGLRFPTHRGYHGPVVKSALPQAILAAACAAYLLLRKK